MSELREATKKAVFWAAVYDLFKDVATLSKDDAVRLMLEQDNERVTATDDAGDIMGTLTHSPDKMVWGVVDPEAYKAWIAAKRPDQIVTVVNAMFTKWVLDQAERNDGIVADPETGEMIPGLGREKRFGSFTLRKTATARARVRELVQAMNEMPGVALPPAITALLSPPEEAPDVDR